MITIIDYGMGNIGSICNMLKRIGVPSVIASEPKEILAATKIILPGVGHFDRAMERLAEGTPLREMLQTKVIKEKVPILGICLGMQLLTQGSEEGDLKGLGWIAAKTIRFPTTPELKVPHMGWNVVTPSKTNKLTKDLPDESRFYFVHSYYVKVDDPQYSILRTTYGVEFDSAINRENIYGVQFHPEKSHKFGIGLLRNFAGL